MAAARYFRFTKPATTTGVQTVTGVGFTPKALIIWSTRQTTTGPTDGVQMLFGMTDGTAQMCRFIRHPDNEATTTSAQSEQTDCLVFMTSATSGATPTVQVEGDFQSFTSDGFQIDWLTNDSDETIFHGIAFGGDDLQIDYTATKITVNAAGTIDVTTGFQPDSFVVIGGAADEFGTGDYNLGAPFGSIHGFGFSNATDDVCGWTLGQGTGGAADTYRGQHTDRCASIRVANLAGASDLCSIQITATSSTGYTITRTVGSTANQPLQHVLAIKGLQTALGSFSTPASTGDYSLALSFQPTLLLTQTHGSSSTTADGMSMSVGAWSSGGSGGTWIGGTDAANPSVYARDHYEDAVLKHRQPASTGSSSTADIVATVDSVSTSGATLNFSTVPASAATVLYIAFAPTTTGSRPVAYEEPCAITEPRIFAKITNTTETLKIGVHPLRDSAAMGGFAEPRLIDIGPMTRVASDVSTGAWSAQTAYAKIADTDRSYRGKSETRTSLRNSDVEFYLTSNAQRQAGGPPRVLFSGKAFGDAAEENMILGLSVNDLIGAEYSLFNEEKQIPQRDVSVAFFPNCPTDTLGMGEPIVGGTRRPLDQATANSENAEGVVEGIYVGQLTIGAATSTPTAITLADFVATLQAALDNGTLYATWGPRVGFGDCLQLISLGTVPSDYDALGAIIGYGDLDRELANGTATGGNTYEAVLVAGHAIKEVLDGNNGNPSIWIDDTQIDPAQFGVSVWCPQVPGYTTHWSTAFGSDLFTDLTDADGNTRRYTLILFSSASDYGTSVAAGARVHLDCVGLEDTGDGTGTAITGYYALYKHVLINFILQNYTSGAWLDVPQFLFSDGVTYLDRVNETSFTTAATVAALTMGTTIYGSFTIKDRASVRDVIANFNLSGGCVLAQDDYGRLFIKVLDLRRTHFLQNAEGETHATLRDKVDILPGFWLEPKPDWQVNSLTYQYGWNDYTGAYERGAGGGGTAARVSDSTSIARDGELRKTIALPYVSHDATAEAVATYYLDLFKNLPHVAHYTRRGLCGLEDDVLDGVPITHYNGYGSSGWSAHCVWILSKTFDPKRMCCTFSALDVESLIADEEAVTLEALTLDPVALEDLYSDDDGSALTKDT